MHNQRLMQDQLSLFPHTIGNDPAQTMEGRLLATESNEFSETSNLWSKLSETSSNLFFNDAFQSWENLVAPAFLTTSQANSILTSPGRAAQEVRPAIVSPMLLYSGMPSPSHADSFDNLFDFNGDVATGDKLYDAQSLPDDNPYVSSYTRGHIPSKEDEGRPAMGLPHKRVRRMQSEEVTTNYIKRQRTAKPSTERKLKGKEKGKSLL